MASQGQLGSKEKPRRSCKTKVGRAAMDSINNNNTTAIMRIHFRSLKEGICRHSRKCTSLCNRGTKDTCEQRGNTLKIVNVDYFHELSSNSNKGEKGAAITCTAPAVKCCCTVRFRLAFVDAKADAERV